MARNYFEKAADALIRVHAQIDRPASGFFGLLADKGYIPVESGETLTAKAIRSLFGGLASGVETVGRLNQREFDFFDLLDAKGYISQDNVARLVPASVANDNSSDRRAA